LADLDWQPLVIDDENKVLFSCFDSSRSEDLARGRIDSNQLFDMGTRLDIANVNGDLDDYIKIVLLHHHPYPYHADVEERILSGGDQYEITVADFPPWYAREQLLELRGAERFLTWGAGRRVSLILHGHKHVPRFVTDSFKTASKRYRSLAVIGCGSSTGPVVPTCRTI
jgi:hypothetical protein